VGVVHFSLHIFSHSLFVVVVVKAKEPIGGEGMRARWIVRPFSCSIAMSCIRTTRLLEDGRAKKKSLSVNFER
jgi:hypothetical protein